MNRRKKITSPESITNSQPIAGQGSISATEPVVNVDPKVVTIKDLIKDMCIPTLRKLGDCLNSLTERFRYDYSDNTKESLSSSENLDNFSEIKLQVSYIRSVVNQDLMDLLDQNIAHYEALVKKESQSTDFMGNYISKEVLRRNIKLNKMTINGGSGEFGLLLGNVVEHLVNKKGNRLIEVSDKKLAYMVFISCLLIGGEIINPATLAVFIGKGRKGKSIIDPDLLAAFIEEMKTK